MCSSSALKVLRRFEVMPFPQDEQTQILIWTFVGLHSSALFLRLDKAVSSLPRSPNCASAHWIDLLASVQVRTCWSALEERLRSSFESIGNDATVGSYYRCLAAAALVPDLDSVNDAFVRAVQRIRLARQVSDKEGRDRATKRKERSRTPGRGQETGQQN